MAKRVIVGLKWARELEAKPSCIPAGRARGAKALGVRYEKALESYLGSGCTRGCWYEFEDKNGHGYCQTDFEIWQPNLNRRIVLELKYSWCEDGQIELNKLYLPVVRAAKPAMLTVGVVVSKNLLTRMPRVEVFEDVFAAASAASRGTHSLWHFVPIGVHSKRKAGLRHSSSIDFGSVAP